MRQARVSRPARCPPRRRAPRRSLRGWLVAAAALTDCSSLVDPPLPPGARRLTPPAVYARWWAMTEACSGLHGNFAAVTWYVTVGAPSITVGRQTDLAGYWSSASNRIVLADTAALEGSEIRHEMLHALLGPGVAGHPRAQFLGRCAGTVTCLGACNTEAGPPPPPDPAAVTVPPTALRVSGVVDPAAPRRAVDDGWFTFTILVTNPRATPVAVALAPSGDAGPPVSFSWVATRLCVIAGRPGLRSCGESERDERADDPASVTRFAAGEMKRFVVDFRVSHRDSVYWDLPPGTYAFTGYYGGRFVPRYYNGRLVDYEASPVRSAPDTAVLGP